LTTCLLHTSPTTHLHAFPTRRSSDLDQNLELSATHLGADRVAADVVARPTDKMLDVAERAADLLLQAGGLERAVLIELRGGHREDRKSTRLNSSHGSISYAVFCLKKK